MSQSSKKIGVLKLFRKIFRLRVLLPILVLLPLVSIVFFNLKDNVWDFRDSDTETSTVASPDEPYKDGYTSVRYLKQGWSKNQSLWFYSTTQGSDLLPYNFFIALQQADGKRALADNENVKRWRYLPRGKTSHNPDGLPVGFVKDSYRDRDYLGLSCSACHTTQISYKQTALRIDGGPAMADMEGFLRDLAAALDATAQLDPANQQCASASTRCTEFVDKVQKLGGYKNKEEIVADLYKYRWQINSYIAINGSDVPYGYARLDAFGRIYNRVLEHVLLTDQISDLLPEIYTDPAELAAVKAALAPVLSGEQKDHAVERVLPLLTDAQRRTFLKTIFNPPNAPVSYPFLWDIAQHDYVQWNGIASNAGLGPLGRNAGEVIGVFGTLDWNVSKKFSLSALIGGQGLKKDHISYESSVYVHNLRLIESQLKDLQSPEWQPDVLGAIDSKARDRGEIQFNQHCAACHAQIKRDDPNRRVVASMSKLEAAGTDPGMAANSVADQGRSGFLRNQYVGAGGTGDILINKKAPAAALLTKTTTGVVADPYPNANYLRRVSDWITDLAVAYFTNDIKASLKSGNYNPDTTANPYASLLSYKGRSLNGIWATAPYLHNGSVPTLYDILLPARRKGDPAGDDYRPDKFRVGSREFDPAKVGFITEGYEGFLFDTSLPANSNAGHEYGTIHDGTLEKRGLKPLTPDQRKDLLEYLKSL